MLSGGHIHCSPTLQLDTLLHAAFANCFKDVFNVRVSLISSNDIHMKRVYRRGMHKVKIKDHGHKVTFRSARLREGQSVGVVMGPVKDGSVWNNKHVSLQAVTHGTDTMGNLTTMVSNHMTTCSDDPQPQQKAILTFLALSVY